MIAPGIGATFYAVMPSPTDGSVWGTLRGNPGAIVRIDPTKNPHKALAEMYNVPLPGFGPRGGDIDKQGRVWSQRNVYDPRSGERREDARCAIFQRAGDAAPLDQNRTALAERSLVEGQLIPVQRGLQALEPFVHH